MLKKEQYKGTCEGYETWHIFCFLYIFSSLSSLYLRMIIVNLSLMYNIVVFILV
jgi:hypothetical protein